MLVKTEASRPFAGHPVIDHLIELRAFIGMVLVLSFTGCMYVLPSYLEKVYF